MRRINRWLGDESALKNSLLREIGKANLQNFSVLDIGAGSGEFLRIIAKFARQQNRQANLFGLELNARSAGSILEESKDFSEISAIRGNALSLPFDNNIFDYTICSLFTHHFTDENIIKILAEMKRVSRRKIFVIDLHRHPLAYLLYTTAGKIVIKNRLTRHDGALSILRAFKPEELEELARKASLENVTVERHFPFRLVLSGS